jgi:site-specific recombinase XerD
MEADAKAPTKYTVAEARDRFKADREASGHKKKSIDRYAYDLNQLATFLAGRNVTQLRAVSVDDLSDWKATWTEGAKDKKQQRLCTFFKWCRKRKYIEDGSETVTA